MIVSCYSCGKEIDRKPYWVKRGRKFACSKECQTKAKRTGSNVECGNCGVIFYKIKNQIEKTPANYCSKNCAATITNFQRGLKSKHSYREIALRNLDHKCNRCDWDKEINVLEVHHKDRNQENIDISNLEILCPTCHCLDHYKEKDGKWTPRN